jgi:predicted TIM-barrel fold metal-dependent hydrolase
MDRDWKTLRREVPWVKRPPSEYVREHIRVTTQPIDAPVGSSILADVISQLRSDDMLMYASDYPHKYGDNSPDIREFLSAPQTERLMWANAWSCYRLERRLGRPP